MPHDLSLSPPPAAPRLPWLAGLVLGPPDGTRQRVRRLLLALPAYLLVGALLAASVTLGHTRSWQAALVGTYLAVGLTAFYAVLRSGLSARFREPTLAFPQVLFSIGAVCLGYALIPRGRGLAMMWLCLILVYDMRVLSARQAVAAVLGAAAGLLLALGGLWWTQPASTLKIEAINIGMGGLTLPALLFLSRTARRLVQRSQQQRKDLEAALQRLQALSVRDALTQVYNRGHMQSLLEEEQARQRRSGRPWCVALLDIDLFKRINDGHGHAVGDAVLRRFGGLAETALGRRGAVARWGGGEEFLVLLPDCALPQALEAVAQVQAAVRGCDWAALAPGLRVSFSAGLAEQSGGRDVACVLDEADRALYRAKAEGRDRLAAGEAHG